MTVSEAVRMVINHLYKLREGDVEYDFNDVLEMSFTTVLPSGNIKKWVRITVEDCEAPDMD